jgi:hypothetical protein
MEVGQGPNWGCSAKGKKICDLIKRFGLVMTFIEHLEIVTVCYYTVLFNSGTRLLTAEYRLLNIPSLAGVRLWFPTA